MKAVLQFSTLSVALLLTGCSGGDADLKVAETPQQAASQLESAFAAAPPEFQGAAAAASEALRTDNYDRAVESLQTIKASQSVTVDQGLAIHSSMVTLEARLLNAMEAGDENAKRAYQMLKAMKQK